jgi:large subunit ribosomal protein L21
MYAVFVDGSRQYRVMEGDLVQVDFRDKQKGDAVEFHRVLLHKSSDAPAQIGLPALDGFRVIGQVEEQTSTKQVIQYFRRRKNYRRLKGHRQPYTLVRVKNILAAGQEPPAASAPAPAAP